MNNGLHLRQHGDLDFRGLRSPTPGTNGAGASLPARIPAYGRAARRLRRSQAALLLGLSRPL